MSNLGIAQTEITGASGGGGGGSTLNFRGTWSAVTAYSTNDMVVRNGSTYIAVQGNTGVDPYLDASGTGVPAFIQGQPGTYTASVTSVNQTFPANVTAGHLLIVFASGTTTTGLAISDTQNNVWTQFYQDSTTFGASNVQTGWWAIAKPGATTVTVSWTGATTATMAVAEYSNISPVDQSGATNTGNSAAWSTNSVTTTQAEELIIVLSAAALGALTTTAPFTQREAMSLSSVIYAAISDDVVSATSTYSASGTNTSSAWSAKIITFKAGHTGANWALLTQGLNYAGTWTSTAIYNFNDVVVYNNSFYTSVVAGAQDNQGNNPQTDGGTHWQLLDQGFHWLGTWSSATTYQPYDVVAYSSSSYVGLTLNNLNNTPSTSPSNWALMAQAGQVAPRQQTVFSMPSASITSVQISSNVLTLTATNSFSTQGFGTGTGQLNTFYLTGLTNATFLNGQVITATSVSGTTVVANFTHSNYGPTADTGTATMSIPVNGIYWTTITLGKTFALSYIQCNQPNRIELYSTQTSRTNDVGRPATQQPTQFTQHGVILDLNLDGVIASYTSWVLSPEAYGADLQVPTSPTTSITAALTNISGSPTTNGFQITFTYTFEEQ
jgi:hypothetical protein